MTNRPPAPPRSLAPGLPLSRRPAPGHLLWVVVVAAVIALTIVPAAAQIEIFNETFEDYDTSSISCVCNEIGNGFWYSGNSIAVSANIANLDIMQIMIQAPASKMRVVGGAPATGAWPITLTVGGNVIGSGEYYYFKYYVGETPYYQAVIDLEEFNPPASTVSICMSPAPEGYGYLQYNNNGYGAISMASFMGLVSTDKPGYVIHIWDGSHGKIDKSIQVTSIERHRWSNRLTVLDTLGPNNITTVSLIRDTPLDVVNLSSLYITDKSGVTYNSVNSHNNATFWILGRYYPLAVSIDNGLGKIFNRTISITGIDDPDPGDPAGPTNATTTIYVRDSQTGALLSGAHILVEGTPGVDDWTEYVNATLPSGTGSYSLPGMPYQYRIIASAAGYTYPAGLQYFRAGDTVVVGLEPALAAPENESTTYLEFYVRDLAGNPIGGAAIEVADQWLYSNSLGYAKFEVAKNASYSYTVSRSGYLKLAGTATVADGPRYSVNVVLGAGTVPTLTPTPGPGGPGATPTLDPRSPVEKAAAGLDALLANAETFGLLAAMILLVYMTFWLVPRR